MALINHLCPVTKKQDIHRSSHKAGFLFSGIIFALFISQPLFWTSNLWAQDLPAKEETTNQEQTGKKPNGEKQQTEETRKPTPNTMNDIDEKLKALDNLFTPIHWSDPITGLAIGGYDPISYFSGQEQRVQSDAHEYVWHGISWRFLNEGNKRAFQRSPNLYVPVFAGYDAYALSNGVLAQGLPSIWAINEGRLYLFHSPVNRHLWQENSEKLKTKTRENWQTLSLDLPRYKIGQ